MIKNIEKITGYKIDSSGNVFNTKGKKMYTRIKKKSGYEVIKIGDRRKSGIVKEYVVHRLVAEAFIENPENKPFVNHKDRNRLNNCVDNLEWVNNKQNQIHWVLNESKIIDQIRCIINKLPDGFLAKDLLPIIIKEIEEIHLK